MQRELTESVSWSGATVEEGVIRGIKLLGEKSRNGNRYPSSVRKAAHKMMEGCRVNLNHPGRKTQGEDRPVESRVGKLVNVREDKDGTYADFLFLKSHPMAGAIMEAAQRMPDLYGFSINGRGRVKEHKGETIVESIDSLRSVDLVADPATTKSLFESADPPEAKSCEQLVGELIAALVAEGKEDLVKDAIKLRKKLGGGDAPEESAAPAAEEAPQEESWKQEYAALKLEKDCRTLLESSKVPADTELVESLMAMSSDEAREKFVAWHKRTKAVKTPKSSEPVKVGDRVEPNWSNILRSRN